MLASFYLTGLSVHAFTGPGDNQPAPRGLAIIGQIARDWGFANHAGGKMTWAELRLH